MASATSCSRRAEEWIGADDERVGMQFGLGGKTASKSPSVLACKSGAAARSRGPPPAALLSSARHRDWSGSRAPRSSRRGHQLAAAFQPLRPHLDAKMVTPVRLPPGRFKAATSPGLTGSLPTDEDDRNCRRRALAANAAGVRRPQRSRRSARPDRPPTPAVGRSGPLPSDIRSRRSVLDEAGFLQTLAEGAQVIRRPGRASH